MRLSRMAWRNVWRNRRRSWITIGAMALALAALLVYAGLMQGYMAAMERNIVELETSDVQVFAPGYRDRPSLYQRIADPEALLSELEAEGFRAAPRLLGTGLAAGADTAAGARLVGVDARRDPAVSGIHAQVRVGEWLDPAAPRGVVLGWRLARTLGVGAGDEVLILSQAADGSIANELYAVRGVLKSVGDSIDRAGIFMLGPTFRELMAVDEGAHQLLVRRPARLSLPAAGQRVSALANGLEVKTWKELLPTLAQMMEGQRAAVMVMFLVVYIAIAILILNTVLMAVFERVRELGVLKAVGMSPWAVFRLIYLESTFILVVAAALGFGLGLPWLWYLAAFGIDVSGMSSISIQGVAWDPIWRAEINRAVFTDPVVTLVVITGLAVFYPAWRAARLAPVAALHHR